MWQDEENIEPLCLLHWYKSTDTDTKPFRKATEHMWQDEGNLEPLYLLYWYKSTDTDTKPSRKATEHMWQDDENLEPLALPSPALRAARAPPDSASVPETSAMSPLQIKSM